MPYYQYEANLELKLNNSFELNKIEKIEEKKFNEILSKEENTIISLLDLFYPPRFWKRENGKTDFYPTLPIERRRVALELLQQEMMNGNISSKLNKIDLENGFKRLLAGDFTHAIVYFGFTALQSYAVAKYDHNQCAIIDIKNPLATLIKTSLFIELMIEHNHLPFETLHFEIVYNLFQNWNKKRLQKLKIDLLSEEDWPLIDAVSVLANFYALPGWVINAANVTGFSLQPIHQPLRWARETAENSTESEYFKRKIGRIDKGELPNDLSQLYEEWNKTLKKIKYAMSFERIIHNGGENIDTISVRVDKKSFLIWAKQRGYQLYLEHPLPPSKTI